MVGQLALRQETRIGLMTVLERVAIRGNGPVCRRGEINAAVVHVFRQIHRFLTASSRFADLSASFPSHTKAHMNEFWVNGARVSCRALCRGQMQWVDVLRRANAFLRFRPEHVVELCLQGKV